MPSGIKVGSAYSTYDLDISELRRNAAEAKKLLTDLQATGQKVGARAAQAPGGNTQAAQLQKTRREAESAIRSFERLDRQYNRLRDSEIRVARASGDHAKALRLVETELARASTNTIRYNNLLTQQARIQRDVARSSGAGGGSGGGLGGALRSGAGALGITIGAQQAIQFTGEAIRMANSLEKTQVTVRVLSGSVERYNEVLETARKGQQLYGGSLEENLRGLGSLVNLSNRSGASLEQLDNVSRRLAIVDPVQGIEGANIALKEFLTGTGGEAALSLARRFELPKKAIAELAKEGISAKDRLEALDRLLAEQGITQQVLAARAKTTAATYDQLGVAVENAKIAFGQATAEGFEPAARGLERVIQAALGSKKALIELRQVMTGQGPTEAARAITTEQVDERLKQTKESLAFRAFNQGGPFRGAKEFEQDKARIDGLRQSLIDLSLASQQNETTIKASLTLLQAGAITTQQFADIIASLTARQRGAIDVEDRRSIALANNAKKQKELTDAAAETNQQIADGIIKSADMANRQRDLTDASALAARGLLGSGDQAILLAQKYGIAESAARGLILAQQQLLNQGALSDQRAGERSGGSARSASELTIAKDAGRSRAQSVAAAKARQTESLETTAQRVARLRREIVGLTAGSAAYIDKQTELTLAQRALRSEQEAAAKANARNTKSAITDAQKRLDLTERTTDALRKQAEAAIDARLAGVEDRRKRREEEKRVNQARRVLNNPNASAEQRAAALDVLEEVPLLQAKRQMDIEEKQLTAGAALKNGKLYQSIAGGATPLPGSSVLPSGASALGAIPGPIAAPMSNALAPILNLSIAVFLDGNEIARQVEVRANDGVIVKLQEGLSKALSAGTIKRGGS